jgi:hypothetical protein
MRQQAARRQFILQSAVMKPVTSRCSINGLITAACCQRAASGVEHSMFDSQLHCLFPLLQLGYWLRKAVLVAGLLVA